MKDPGRIGRRRFVRLAAVAAAAAAMNPLTPTSTPAAEPPRRARRSSGRPPEPAVRAEIALQKKQLDSMLQVIRSYELPAGSPPATIFRPLSPRRRA